MEENIATFLEIKSLEQKKKKLNYLNKSKVAK